MKDTGNEPSEAVFNRIRAADTIWVRLGAFEENGSWRLAFLELVTPEAPPGWSETLWRYEEAILSAFTIRGIEVAKWCAAKIIRIEDLDIQIGDVPSGPTYWSRHASSERSNGFEALRWPHIMYSLPMAISRSVPNNPLVASKSPSFINLNAAAASLLAVQANSGGAFPQSAAFREQDRSGKIGQVAISLVDVSVTMEGEDLVDMTVELASGSPGPSIPVPQDETPVVTFATPEGLPPASWLVLKKGGVGWTGVFSTGHFAPSPVTE